MLQQYQIDAIVIIGNPGPFARSLVLEGRSTRMIGFSSLLAENALPPENMLLADLVFDRQMRDNLEKFDLNISGTERLGFWESQYDGEPRQQLEQFVPFGPAFEMIMWSNDTE
jgi:hypothetical protein